MKRSRIAVCLSGQPRTWKTCAANIRAFFEPAGDVDFFISTWDRNTWWSDGKAYLEDADTEGLREAYDPVACRINPLPKKFGWNGLFDSFASSVHDKKTHEIANSFLYDVVVKGRLDCVFDPRLTFKPGPVEPMTAYSVNHMERMPHEYYGANFSDMWFHSGSMEMDILADCMRDADIIEHEDYGPGVLLWNHMTRYRIHPAHSPAMVLNTIVRKEFEHLDGIADYEEIKANFAGWAGR